VAVVEDAVVMVVVTSGQGHSLDGGGVSGGVEDVVVMMVVAVIDLEVDTDYHNI